MHPVVNDRGFKVGDRIRIKQELRDDTKKIDNHQWFIGRTGIITRLTTLRDSGEECDDGAWVQLDEPTGQREPDLMYLDELELV